jgi:hypothetical protein
MHVLANSPGGTLVSSDSELADRDAIRELYAAYCFMTDLGRPDLLADTFTDDAVFWLNDRGSFRGKDEIRKQLEKRAGKAIHFVHNVSVQRVDRPLAWAHAYFHILNPSDGSCAAYGLYDDVLRHDSGRWRWHLRRAEFLFRADAYAATAAPRPDFGIELEGSIGFIENYERSKSEGGSR